MKMYNKMPGVITVLVVILSILFTTEATTLLKMDLNELIGRADIIVIGKAQESACYSNNGGDIYTNTEFVVTQVIKGNNVGNIVVKIPGGTSGGKSIVVFESPTLTKDGSYLLFLYANQENYMSNVVGWTQGRFTVENGTIQENGRSVDEFISEIQSLMRKAEGGSNE